MGYSASTWAKVKADYESGNYSKAQLHKKYTISEKAISNKLIKEGWVKGKNKPLIEQGIAERNIAMFAKHGMTQDKVVEKLVEGVLYGQKAMEELAKYIEINKPTGDEEDSKKSGNFSWMYFFPDNSWNYAIEIKSCYKCGSKNIKIITCN